jgi:hypothetical protein
MARKKLKSKSRNKKTLKSKSKSKKHSKKDGRLIYKSGICDKYEPEYDSDKDTHHIYRKYVRHGESGENELKIVKILETLYNANPSNYNKNLIIIRNIGEDSEGEFYETDVIDTYVTLDYDNKLKLIEQLNKLNETRRFLQKNNIAYIDWKLDNTGLDSKGKIKLFDFDCCGTFTNQIKEIKSKWEIEPPIDSHYYKYANTIFDKYSCNNTPLNLDTFLFRNMLFNIGEQTDLPL